MAAAGGAARPALTAHTDGDLVVTGGTLSLSKNSTIGGSLIAGGGEIIVDGKINGFLKAGSGSLVLNGSVGKYLDSRGQKVTINGTVAGESALSANEILIGRNATFGQKVRYWSDNNVNFGQSVKSGQAVSDESLKISGGSWRFLGFASLMALLWYLGAAFVFIVLIQYLFGRRIQRAADTLSGHTALRFIAYGFLFFILAPILIFISLLTLVGIPLGLLMMVFYIALILLASIITSVVLANWFNTHYTFQTGRWRQIWTALAIFILVKIVSLIPVAGWLLMIAAICLAFGLLVRQFIHPRGEKAALDVPQY